MRPVVDLDAIRLARKDRDKPLANACGFMTVIPRTSLYVVMQQGMERVLKSVHGQVGELPQNRYLMNINFMGTYHCVQAALATMRRQQSGHFVLLSSVAGKLGAPMLTAYCASKWAIRGFSIALRAELHGSGIGVTTVYPAWVETPMIHQEQDATQLLNVQALLTAEQVAAEILQAVTAERRDLTLAPNPDIALMLQIMKDDPDKAEQLAGAAFRQRMAETSVQQQG